jgi:hypothetical protein
MMHRAGHLHPARLLGSLGVREAPAGVAIVLFAVLQYLFLIRLWRGYPLKASGLYIDEAIVHGGLWLSFVGAIVITIVVPLRWRSRSAAARRLEKPATNKSFDALRAALAQLVRRADLATAPVLRYTPKNAFALEVRDSSADSESAVVVGLHQRRVQAEAPDTFAAQLGHEISHLELGTTRLEIIARRAAGLHFAILGWLITVFLLVLGFIDTGRLDNTPSAGYLAVWDPVVYAKLASHIAVLALSSLIILVYSYYFVVRREHLHDLRGSQLAGTAVLADTVFAPLPSRGNLLGDIRDFIGLHPGSRGRRRVILEQDFLLLAPVSYPLVVAAVQPLALLLATGWHEELGLERAWWNLLLTVCSGLLLYLVLSADIARLAIGVLTRRHYWLLLPVYGLAAGMATQVPRVVMEILFGLRKGLPVKQIVPRILEGTLDGSATIAMMLTLLLLAATYTAAVRIAAVGETRSRRGTTMLAMLLAAVTVCAFTAASLATSRFLGHVLFSATAVMLAASVWFSAMSRCTACGRRRLGAMLWKTACRHDGHEHLPQLRRWHSEPYSQHLAEIHQSRP